MVAIQNNNNLANELINFQAESSRTIACELFPFQNLLVRKTIGYILPLVVKKKKKVPIDFNKESYIKNNDLKAQSVGVKNASFMSSHAVIFLSGSEQTS